MNAMGLTPQEFTTAQLNGQPVAVRQTHRYWTAADYVPGAPESTEYEPVAVTVAAPIALSMEDITAVLFGHCLRSDELADDAGLRRLVADTVINAGSGGIEELRCQLGEHEPFLGAEQAAHLAHCRQRAAAVFAPRPAGQPHREFAAAR